LYTSPVNVLRLRREKENKKKANIASFCRRFKEFITYFKGEKVLCLGARFGEEVIALRKMGYTDTVGLDLNPGKKSKYVIKGDFHHMPFKDNSFNSVYTNCIDHAWDIKSLFSEVDRVLRKDGVFILEVAHILKANKKLRRSLVKVGSKYESIVFDKISDMLKDVEGFNLVENFRGKYGKIIVVFNNSKEIDNE
jgi:ubiquinone/menaquinone biosynthesis C-methylase UbiE